MRTEKQLLLDDIKEKIASSDTLIITKYERLNPDLAWEFRSNLKEKGAAFEIVKKRVLAKAIQQCDLDLALEDLSGSIGLVFSKEENIASLKFLYQFDKEKGADFSVLYSFILGQKYSSDEAKQLSKIPPKNELRAQFLGLLEAPMSQTLAVFESLLTSILYCFENKIENKK